MDKRMAKVRKHGRADKTIQHSKITPTVLAEFKEPLTQVPIDTPQMNMANKSKQTL